VKHGQLLSKYLSARKPPAERTEILNKQREILQNLDATASVSPNTLDEEELANYKKRRADKLAKILKERIQHWQPIVYDEYKALEYLLGRSAPEYAVLLNIMSEIEQRDPAFKPLSFFDFGAGVGTGVWAASKLWRSSIHEYCLVDCSAHMNDLSAFILRDGDENKEMQLKNVYHRQFLPSSPLKYDLVMSAYSLMELSGYQQRMEVVDNLWNKCDGYLMFVERGTMAGFKLIDEVRERLIGSNAQVFAPCPHSAACPRLAANDRTPCNFELSYNSLPIADSTHNRKELYSYVVVRKPGGGADVMWPRIVRPVLQRHKHAICRMCTSNGKLGEVIFSPGKHGK
jgi:ribosomal protein RSM22 (predicted rRNA methylase)